MLGEDFLAIGLNLAEGDGLEAGALQPEAEAADSAEQVKDAHYIPAGT
jgi:hypothetical protein